VVSDDVAFDPTSQGGVALLGNNGAGKSTRAGELEVLKLRELACRNNR